MNKEEKQETAVPSAEGTPCETSVHPPTLKDMLGEMSLREWIRTVRSGLRKPRTSGEYRYAVQEVRRLWSPVCGMSLPLLLIGLLMAMPEPVVSNIESIPVTIEAQKVEELLKDDAAVNEPEPDPVEPPPDNAVLSSEIGDSSALPGLASSAVGTATAAGTAPAFSPQPAAFDSVAMIKSPIKMKGVYASRSPGARGLAMNKFGGDKRTEDAVMRALRWIKTQQRPDGGWNGQSEGMGCTGFSILAYLAHGEFPGSSEEFGMTVQRAIEFLMRQPNHDPMTTHALAEAYGMTMNPNLKDVAAKSLKGMVDKLRVTKWGPGRDGDGTTRPDLLDMTFNVMALRSAKLSNIKIEGSEEALKKLKEGFMAQGNRELGGFSSDHYGPPGPNYRRTGTWHFMIGVVGMQYLGAYADPIVEKTMELLDDIWPPPTLGTTDIACCPVRSNYWSTMVFFNTGGKRWEKWNKDMKDVYVKGQEVEKGKYKDPNGKEHEIGYWRCEDQHIGQQPIMPTCYIVQQLMVYYRYLPTSSKEAWQGEAETLATPADKGDIKVDVGNL